MSISHNSDFQQDAPLLPCGAPLPLPADQPHQTHARRKSLHDHRHRQVQSSIQAIAVYNNEYDFQDIIVVTRYGHASVLISEEFNYVI